MTLHVLIARTTEETKTITVEVPDDATTEQQIAAIEKAPETFDRGGYTDGDTIGLAGFVYQTADMSGDPLYEVDLD